jgi:hypothetical protein
VRSDRPYPEGVAPERLAHVRSAYSEIIVDGDDESRYLWFGFSRQAGAWLTDGKPDHRLVRARGQAAFDLAELYQERAPRSALFLGLGAGNAPMHTARVHPDCSVTVVEIDPQVAELAERFFGFDSGRCRLELADALAFLEAGDERVDRIVADCYVARGGASEEGMAQPHLRGERFHRALCARLAEDGILVLNLTGPLWDPQRQAELVLLERELGYVRVHSVDGDGAASLTGEMLRSPEHYFTAFVSRLPLADAATLEQRLAAFMDGPFADERLPQFVANRLESYQDTNPPRSRNLTP